MQDRRHGNRRTRRIRNLFSYLNRRDLFKKGRRRDEDEYQAHPDWFEEERKRGG